MNTKVASVAINEFNSVIYSNGVRGVLLVALIAIVAIGAAQVNWVADWGLSALTLAIIFGMILGNTLFSRIEAQTDVGVDFSKQTLLRIGIILYGFRITFQQIASVGWTGLLIDLTMVLMTLTLALNLGTKWFKLDRQTVILIGAGSSFCGAAAILATEPVIKAEAHKVSVAVATVVVFGTVAMFLYPMVFPYLHFSEQAYGVWVGSTVHEVAQVVGAGAAISETAANTAVIEKMLRVMMLAPFLMLLAARGMQVKSDKTANRGLSNNIIPWFAVLFIVTSGLNSLQWLPDALVSMIVQFDTLLLAMAMAALGLRTHIGAIKHAGVKPLLLAACLFLFLTLGGYIINLLITRLLG